MRALALTALLFAASLASAQNVPSMVNYQGRLVDVNGTPLEGMKKLEFNIYTTETGGSPVWGPQTFDGVPLLGGEFNVILSNDTQSRPVAEAFESSNAYLGIKVGNAGGAVGAEFSPRQQFLSVPYAFRSLDSENANVDGLIARIEALENALFPPGSSQVIKTFGPATASLVGGAAAIDGNGNVYFSGIMEPGSVNFGGGVLESTQTSIVLVKLDSGGNHVWSKLFPMNTTNIGFAAAHDLAIDSQGNVVFAFNAVTPVDFGGGDLGTAGDFAGLIYGKFDASGNHLWSRLLAPQVTNPILALAPDDTIYLSSSFSNNTFQIGESLIEPVGKQDIILSKLAANDGAPVWARRYGSDQDDMITGLTVSPAGDIYASGQYQASMNVGTVSLSHHGIVSNSYYNRPWFARFAPSGATTWAIGFAPSSARITTHDYAGGIGLDTDGNVWSSLHWVGDRDFGGGTTGTGITSYFGLLGFDADGNWRANQFWPPFGRAGDKLAILGDSPIAGLDLSTNNGVNFGGSTLMAGMATLAMEPGTDGTTLEHKWSESIVPGAFPSSAPKMTDLFARDGKVVVIGSYGVNIDFGQGAVSAGQQNGLFLLVKRH